MRSLFILMRSFLIAIVFVFSVLASAVWVESCVGARVGHSVIRLGGAL